jgi:hypothetical protein
VLPGIFITWAKRTQIEFPPELEAAFAANGQVIEDWKSLYDKLCASINERIGECTRLRGELEALKSQRAISAEAKPLRRACAAVDLGSCVAPLKMVK